MRVSFPSALHVLFHTYNPNKDSDTCCVYGTLFCTETLVLEIPDSWMDAFNQHVFIEHLLGCGTL